MSESYYYCDGCGCELLGDDVDEVSGGGFNAGGEYAPCPACAKQNPITRDD